ncbi:hypothetical protein [Paraburkholderia bannensis]|uniref:hypothetical protein n=1 Tax=Paraburkholderia bannensis TaxID=765414 RepID=UPI002AC36E35|nr:hypothetical protein [Paraburkholderia bannensis]
MIRNVTLLRLFALVALVYSQGSYAWTVGCQAQLRDLIVPNLLHLSMKREDVHVEMEDHDGGVYSVRLFVPANSPENLDKQMSIGWVNLDTNAMQALDVTRDPDHPDVLNVDKEKFRRFISVCIDPHSKENSYCNNLNDTASQDESVIDSQAADKFVIGKGRLQLYSAPDARCKLDGVFIVESDSVNAYAEYGSFTSIDYVNPRSKRSVKGWVESNRLKSSPK